MVLSLSVIALLFVATSALQQYCPRATDLQAAYGSPTIRDGGWTLSGGGGASTKAAFNILGGSVEYDVDFSRVNVGVNGNIYTISPTFNNPSAAFDKNANYCDGQGAAGSSQFCLELDWIETNGNCGGATTIHARAGGGSDGCTAWGCTNLYNYNGRSSFHMKIQHATDGTMTVIRDGVTISSGNYNPGPQSLDVQTIQSVLSSKGVVVYSSLWTGWVPSPPAGCPGGSGDLGSSYFTISNLKITGTVVQGPTPTLCATQGPVTPVAPVPVVPVTAPVVIPAPRINTVSTPNSRIPTVGSFQVQVGYQAFENSRITVDILNSIGWGWLGSGTHDVSTGTGTVTVTVSISGSIPLVNTIQLKSWIVKTANIGNWQITTGTPAEKFYPVSVGSSPVPVVTPQPVPVAPRPVPVAPRPVTPPPVPVAPKPVPVSQPVVSSGCSAAIFGTGNSDWWNAVKVSVGANSVRITCTDTAVTSACVYGWIDASQPVWTCQMSGVCKSPRPTCTKPSGSRLDDEGQTGDSSTGLANYAIVLIALAAVLAVLLVFAGVVYVVRRSNQLERV